MRRLLALGLCLIARTAGAQVESPRILLDDFEKDPKGWSFVGGEEFPGAKGSLTLDGAVAHGGIRSYRLAADFTGGGAYVGTWRDLASLQGKDFREIRLRVMAHGADRLGVRIVDGSNQCHQKNGGFALAATAEWQEVVIPIREVVGGEHWAGANDGKWHGPIKAFGLNLSKEGGAKKSIWIDDVELVSGAVVEGRPTVLPALLSAPSCRPGFGVRVTFRWEAEPIGRDCGVFVHVLNSKGQMAFQADHGLPVATGDWTGRVEHARTLLAPVDAAEGEYRIVVGLYDARGRAALKPGQGVTALGGEAYQVGVLKIDSNAPLPKLPAPTLNLNGFKLTFNEEFNDLSVSRAGPGTRWIAHTPYWGDFGDAGFADPKDGFPFTVDKGILRIEARKTEAGWRTGLLSSVDPEGNGFSQKYGYFETRAKFPKGPGMWPAFWLMGVRGIKEKGITNPEIDVVEQYSAIPNCLSMTLHLWGPDKKHTAEADSAVVAGMADDFHTYGAMVDESQIVWYFDGVELWRTKTPEAAKVPLYVMVNLAMGSGWPIDKAPSPSYLYVDYVKVYAKTPR
jgi:glycosyl hydrolase family 16